MTTELFPNETLERWATLSEDGLYRWTLGRRWSQGPAEDVAGRRLLWCMLNPSIADAERDDLTITKCIRFSSDNGYDELSVVNLFAYRATDPEALLTVADPEGPGNIGVICDELAMADALVVAWGATVAKVTHPRATAATVSRFNVVGAARRIGIPVYCLGFTAGGHPRHPSRLGYSTPLVEYVGHA